jgi:hypothetical protein
VNFAGVGAEAEPTESSSAATVGFAGVAAFVAPVPGGALRICSENSSRKSENVGLAGGFVDMHGKEKPRTYRPSRQDRLGLQARA